MTTGFQLLADYRSDIGRIERAFSDIEKVNINVLAASIWVMDEQLLNTQLNGLIQLPDITYLEVLDDSGQQWRIGEHQQKLTSVIQKKFELHYRSSTDEMRVGSLIIQADLNAIYERLWDRAILILLSNAVKTFLVAGFILLFVWLNITRHLLQLSQYCQEIDLDEDFEPIQFKNYTKKDEFDQVATAINQMQTQLRHSFTAIKQSKASLQDALADRERLLEVERSYKEELAHQVKERTEELEQSLLILKKAQQVIVEQEKMAALGGLVSGVAHEINTPIGICLTAASTQIIRLDELIELINSQSPSLEQINMLLDEYQESCNLIVNNVTRASELIKKFKTVAAEQKQEEDQDFNLKSTIEEISGAVAVMHTPKEAIVKIDVQPDLRITTNHSLFNQVLTNVISNSFAHAFSNEQNNQLLIHAKMDEGHIRICVQDNGDGIPQDIAEHMFEPFFTTTRGKGGTGLGLSAAYNAATLLKGTISYENSKVLGGAKFIIRLPVGFLAESKDKPS
ncbi:sensor histidine kinase [Shewanella gelidii]|uniref:histidine kinase n=2 Tax=Shewanella gelidii TaxID=1642821 RepID=A0A917JN46_9GAMM|nr:sensor histidine kinase [Shewanella gelidii]